jgi:hypothetical protein
MSFIPLEAHCSGIAQATHTTQRIDAEDIGFVESKVPLADEMQRRPTKGGHRAIFARRPLR